MPAAPSDFSAFADDAPLAEIAVACGTTIRDVRRVILGRVRASSPRRRRHVAAELGCSLTIVGERLH
jgi:hypothetical protein